MKTEICEWLRQNDGLLEISSRLDGAMQVTLREGLGTDRTAWRFSVPDHKLFDNLLDVLSMGVREIDCLRSKNGGRGVTLEDLIRVAKTSVVVSKEVSDKVFGTAIEDSKPDGGQHHVVIVPKHTFPKELDLPSEFERSDFFPREPDPRSYGP
jgi:hypothetical protein